MIFFSVGADLHAIDKLLYKLPVFIPTRHHDMHIVLFEILANIVEHAVCNLSKDDIFAGRAKRSPQKIQLAFSHQKKRLEIIISYEPCYQTKNLQTKQPQVKQPQNFFGGNGKKIIKYLCESHSYGRIGKIAYEKISLVG
ncbi:hypothetical protein BJI48_01355 [Helicobacter sp. 11S02596-1]|nr:hypothetical protein BJI48_01355 [Helicobacter sp. 11S02596-1]